MADCCSQDSASAADCSSQDSASAADCSSQDLVVGDSSQTKGPSSV
ncbi:hypothetical protein [Pseudomonas sp. GV047]|nr:hypothetical protein [Pseudomonas sp. GV047]